MQLLICPTFLDTLEKEGLQLWMFSYFEICSWGRQTPGCQFSLQLKIVQPLSTASWWWKQKIAFSAAIFRVHIWNEDYKLLTWSKNGEPKLKLFFRIWILYTTTISKLDYVHLLAFFYPVDALDWSFSRRSAVSRKWPKWFTCAPQIHSNHQNSTSPYHG